MNDIQYFLTSTLVDENYSSIPESHILRVVNASDYDAAMTREAALREEIEMAKQVQETTDAIVAMVDGQRDHWIEKCGGLKQRLTVAEQRLSQVDGACDLAMSAIDDDERGANFVKIIQAIKDKAALKPAEGEGS